MDDNILALNIERRIRSILDKTGMYYRIFSRQKSEDSIIKKLNEKKKVYSEDGKKMQDFVGVRVVFYFKDDINAFLSILRSWQSYDTNNESNSILELTSIEEEINNLGIDKLQYLLPLTDKIFMPERLNLVMKMDEHETDLFANLMEVQTRYNGNLIDNTYEIQLRTVLSEGWHEVEHDLRYKTRKEGWWINCQEESRLLNGIYAALTSNESQLAKLVDDIAYKAYHNHEWDTMIRFHFRRRTKETKLSDDIAELLDRNVDSIAKTMYRFDRYRVVDILYQISVTVDITTDILAFIANRATINNTELIQLEPNPIKKILDKVFS